MATVGVRVPAKVVLFGEYVVLGGCIGVSATLDQYHEILCVPSRGTGVTIAGVADSESVARYLSPLWQWICGCVGQEECQLKVTYGASFPPHLGWGSSSALILAMMFCGWTLRDDPIERNGIWEAFLGLKRAFSLPGSGMDVFSQLVGGSWICFRQGQSYNCEVAADMASSAERFFATHPLFFAPTGRKASSRKTVQEIDLSQDYSWYTQLSQGIFESLKADCWGSFRSAVLKYTKQLFFQFRTESWYRDHYWTVANTGGSHIAVKPCGAMNGDGFLVWARSKEDAKVFDCGDSGESNVIPLKLGGKPTCVNVTAV